MADYDVYDHRDLQATCLDVDASSQYLALAGKRYLAITTAIDPENCEIKYARRSRYEVGCVRWCPKEINRTYLALTSSQCFELYAIHAGSSVTLVSNVRAHARTVTDLDWDHFNANRLATCSDNDNAHVWDLRDLKKPSLTLNVIAGANQIKWARLLENLCATAYDGDVRVWDIRKGSSPVQYISAHLAKVHCLDWHPRNDVQFISSGQDCTVKEWDFTKPTKPEVHCTLLTPAWKVKYAPFENGILTIPTPHVSHTEHALSLWNSQDLTSAVHNFLGHTDQILDFCWRQPSANESSDFVQIISLSKDCTVRVWTLDARTQQLCDQRRATPELPANGFSDGDLNLLIENLDRTAVDRTHMPKRNRSDTDDQQEFDILHSLNVPNVTIEDINPDKSMMVVSVDHRTHVIRLAIYFSPSNSSTGDSLASSPTSSRFSFQFSRDTTIPNAVKVSAVKRLQEVCEKQQLSSQPAVLEACLRRLPDIVGQMLGNESQPSSVESSIILQSQIMQSPSILASFLDARVPFPRTTGAHFNAVGTLVCFARCETPSEVGQPSGTSQTPRSYSALATFAREPRGYFTIKNTDYSLKSYYQREWRPSRKLLSPSVKLRSRDELEESGSELMVYDATPMLPLHKELAKTYSYPDGETDLVNVCLKNANAAGAVGRKDLVQAWTMLSHCVHLKLRGPLASDFYTPWAMHPFGRRLVTSLIEHLSKMGDVQSAATICCVLGKRPRYQQQPQEQQRPVSRMSATGESVNGGSPYNTVHSSEGLYEAWTGYLQRQRSGSCSEQESSFTEHPPIMEQHAITSVESKVPTVPREHELHERNIKLLDPDMDDRFEALKQAYADILYRWGMLNERACVLKYSHRPNEKYRGMEFVVQCKTCGADSRAPICNDCKMYAMVCSVCQTAVKGLCSVCSLCGHGGHTMHLANWFESQRKCPSGCGCTCLMG